MKVLSACCCSLRHNSSRERRANSVSQGGLTIGCSGCGALHGFRRGGVLRVGPAPLTLASLGAAGTGFGAAHPARRQAWVRRDRDRHIRGVDHRRAPSHVALRRAAMRRGCLARAAERACPGVRHAGAHQFRGPAAPPPPACCSGLPLGLVVGRLTIGCSGCGALHTFERDGSLARRPRTTDPCVVRPPFYPSCR